jgi:hypothetical protein
LQQWATRIAQTAADRVELSDGQIERLNNLTTAADECHDEGNMVVIEAMVTETGPTVLKLTADWPGRLVARTRDSHYGDSARAFLWLNPGASYCPY